VTVEIENRSGTAVDREREDVGRLVLCREHPARELFGRLRVDGRDQLPDGVPRQLGDAVLCPQVVGEAWRAPLVHGLLHLLGYDHGAEMERREAELV